MFDHLDSNRLVRGIDLVLISLCAEAFDGRAYARLTKDVLINIFARRHSDGLRVRLNTVNHEVHFASSSSQIETFQTSAVREGHFGYIQRG